jgi:DNA topoisomerase VI, subunit B
MKLDETKPYLETSGELEEQFFSIQDTGMIFDILRNKMYSNPILAICREITCNARDAHREVGNSDVPVHIHIPNTLEPYYKVKDFGPGISPDRMSNIFIKYTASTKRSDNVQTGGFGLGAKTPFSYSDSFSIITNHNGIQYNYSCNIDETKVGKLMLMSQSPTEEPNGTEIIIPVQAKNFNEFATWTEQACRAWKVRPVIKGARLEWKEYKPILEGSNWSIVQSEGYYNRSAKMIIDGIEYPLDLNVLKKYADASLIDAAQGDFVMHFGVGELSLSASREQIYIDEKTQKVLRERLALIKKEIKQSVQDKIDAMDNLWLANIYYRKQLRQAFHSITFLGTLSWKGIELGDSYAYTKCSVFSFVKGKYTRRNSDPDKLTRVRQDHLAFEESSELYVNDLPLKEPTPRHVKKAFENNPSLKSVQVIVPNDKTTLLDLETSLHLSQMEPKNLSSITKASGRTYTPASSRVLVFKFDRASCAFRQTSYSSLEEDTNEKVLLILKKDTHNNNRVVVRGTNKEVFNNRYLQSICSKFPGVSFYGLDSDTPEDRIEEDFSDMGDFDEFLKEKVLDNKSFDYVKIRFCLQQNDKYSDTRMGRYFASMKSKIVDPNSLFLKRFETEQKVAELCKDADTDMLNIYELLNGEITAAQLQEFGKNNPDLQLRDIIQEYDKKYPLLDSINTYGYDTIVPHIAQYINLIDKDQNKGN